MGVKVKNEKNIKNIAKSNNETYNSTNQGENIIKTKMIKLSSCDNVKNDKVFGELNNIMKNDDINNIAILGGYGSGKSSLIKSYLKKHKNHKDKTLYISLSNFEHNKEVLSGNKSTSTEDNSKGTEDDSKGTEDIIQNKIIIDRILNNITHQIPNNKIVASSLKTKEFTRQKNIFLVVLTTLFIVSTSLIFSKDFRKLIYTIIGNDSKLGIYKAGFSFIYIIISFVFLYNLINLVILLYFDLKNKSSLLKIGNFEATKGEGILSEFEDELMYLLENSEKRIVLIEDIDRLNNFEIISMFREVNINLNLKSNFKSEKIKFIYLIRDSLFPNSLERVKFFDIIIPITPILSYENTYYHMKEIFSNEDICQSTLYLLSTHIGDMRLLNNIFNEFILSENHPSFPEGFSKEKFLALLVYKNLFPIDFEQYYSKKGDLYFSLETVSEELKKSLSTSFNNYSEVIENNDILELEKLKNEKKYPQDSKKEFKEEDRLKRIEFIDQMIRYQLFDWDFTRYAINHNDSVLSYNDYNFYISVVMNKNLDFDFPLDKTENIKEILPKNSKFNMSMLNYDYVLYLYKTKNREEILLFLKFSLKNNKEFILKFFRNKRAEIILYDIIPEKCDEEIYQLIYDELSSVSETFKSHQLFLLIILLTSKDNLDKYKKDNKIILNYEIFDLPESQLNFVTLLNEIIEINQNFNLDIVNNYLVIHKLNVLPGFNDKFIKHILNNNLYKNDYDNYKYIYNNNNENMNFFLIDLFKEKDEKFIIDNSIISCTISDDEITKIFVDNKIIKFIINNQTPNDMVSLLDKVNINSSVFENIELEYINELIKVDDSFLDDYIIYLFDSNKIDYLKHTTKYLSLFLFKTNLFEDRPEIIYETIDKMEKNVVHEFIEENYEVIERVEFFLLIEILNNLKLPMSKELSKFILKNDKNGSFNWHINFEKSDEQVEFYEDIIKQSFTENEIYKINNSKQFFIIESKYYNFFQLLVKKKYFSSITPIDSVQARVNMFRDKRITIDIDIR